MANEQVAGRTSATSRDRIVGEGSVWATVWWLAWPSVVTMLFQTVNNLADISFIGHQLGRNALGGVGVANQVMMTLMALITAVSVGTTALVARFTGADDPKQARESVRQSILLAVAASIVSGGLLLAIGPYLLRTMVGTGPGLRLGVLYLNILLIGVTPLYLLTILTGVFRGLGDTRTPLIVVGAVTLVSILGDYLLIFGIGPFPQLGVVGAGIASVTSKAVGTVVLLYFLKRSHLGHNLMAGWRPAWSWFSRILNIGWPAAIQGLLRTFASMTYYTILRLTPEGVAGVAALTGGVRTEALAFMPGFAFNIVAAAMVGQNLGAGQMQRAKHSAWAATWQGVWIMGLIGVGFFVFARPIAGLITNDPAVVSLIVSYLRINAVSEPFLALSMILTGALEGAGATRMPAVASVLTMWLARLPLTYYLSITLKLGAAGAWIAMSATTVLGGLVILSIFKWSRWEETRV